MDHDTLTVDEMTFLLSEHHGDNDVVDYVDELIEVWVKMKSIKAIVDARMRHVETLALQPRGPLKDVTPARQAIAAAPTPVAVAVAAPEPAPVVAAAAA